MTPHSLAVRVTLLCGVIALTMTGMLGAYFFFSARVAIIGHADEQLIARAEHFRRLIGDARTNRDLEERSVLFENLLGSAGDVLFLQRPGGAPLVEVNPVHVEAPSDVVFAPVGRSISPQDVRATEAPDRPGMRWVAALALSGSDGRPLEVVAGHPLASEMQMIDESRSKVLRSTFASIIISTLLVFLVLRHGLRPLHRVAAQAALIDPMNLAARLSGHDAPRELQDMVAVFNAMLDRIANGYERLSQFSADLAHEIRTPVGALIGQTQVALHRTRTPDEYQQVLESNLEELDRLRLIVDNILFLAKADHAALDMERMPFPLADELQRIAEYFDGPADEAGLHFTVQASGSALVNAALCRRAIHNLVANALRYGTPGTTVRLIGRQAETGSTIAVVNAGKPLHADQLERLFDRFYRVDAGEGRQAESSGLGLAIVKAIMELHGGDSRVTCTSSGIIRFELRFPSSSGPDEPRRSRLRKTEST